MTFGLTDQGFIPKRFEDLVLEYEQLFADAYGDVDTDPDSTVGQMINIMAKQDADLWELMEAVYGSQYRDSATGTSLDGVAASLGLTRKGESSSLTNLLLFGSQGTALTVSKIIETTDGTAFTTTAAVTITVDESGRATVSVTNVLDTTLYTVTINGSAIEFTSDGSATDCFV